MKIMKNKTKMMYGIYDDSPLNVLEKKKENTA